VLRSRYGYVLTSGSTVIAGSQKLSMLIPKIFEFISQHSLPNNAIASIQGLVANIGGKNTLLLSNSSKLDSWVHDFALNNTGLKILSAAPVLSSDANKALTSNFPLLLTPSEKNLSNSTKVIVEKNDTAFQLHSLSSNIEQKFKEQTIKVEHVIYIQAFNKAEDIQSEEAIQALPNAEVLAQLWQHSIHKHSQAAMMLPTWLESIQGIKINLLDSDEEETGLTAALNALIG